jgi:hypothetical protein
MEGVSLLEVLIWVTLSAQIVLYTLLFTKPKQHVILECFIILHIYKLNIAKHRTSGESVPEFAHYHDTSFPHILSFKCHTNRISL